METRQLGIVVLPDDEESRHVARRILRMPCVSPVTSSGSVRQVARAWEPTVHLTNDRKRRSSAELVG